MENSMHSQSDRVARYKEEQRKLCQAELKLIEERLSVSLQSMLESSEQTEEFLKSAHSQIRCAAFMMFASYWGVTQRVAQISESLISSTDTVDVIGMAILCFSSYHAESKNPKAAQLLSAVVVDESRDPEIRGVAYRGVLRVMRPLKSLKLPHEIRFPEDVDWGLVRSLNE